jgi:hypothetical protein
VVNIYEKLIEVRKTVPYLQKETKGYQYNYTASSQVLAAVRAKMDELGLLLIPEVLDHNVTATQDSKGRTSYFTELGMRMTWVDAENPDERIQSTWYAQGLDLEGEKGVGKALTYGEKYFLLKFFNIATDKDDPDSFQRENSGLRESAATSTKGAHKPAAESRDTPPPKPPKPSGESTDFAKFYASASNLGLTEDDVHAAAAEFFKLPSLSSLKDVAGLSRQKLNEFLMWLVSNKRKSA